MMAVDVEYMTVAEVAQKLKVSKRLVYLWIQEGRLPTVKLGFKTYRIRTDHLEEFLATGLDTG